MTVAREGKLSPFVTGTRAPAGFAFATLADAHGRPCLALVIDQVAIGLVEAARAAGVTLGGVDGTPPRLELLDLLECWDASFDAAAEIAGYVEAAGMDDPRWPSFGAGSRVLPPITRPSKMIYAAQNYPDHVQEMREARKFGFNAGALGGDDDFTGDRSKGRPYVFLKAPSALTGAYEDIPIPPEVTQLDWEVELAVVIGAAARRVSATDALRHVAGFMTTNDLSARNLLFRPDRERLRSDWFGGKSHDGFAPMGPLFVPAPFVADHLDLRLHLTVNGETRQDGNTRHLIFSPAEQIEFASRMTTLLPGDVLATGTPGGVGQGTNEFLAPGDVVRAEVEGLGVLRNRVVG